MGLCDPGLAAIFTVSGIHMPRYMNAACGVIPPPTGIPLTNAGGLPCVSGVLPENEGTSSNNNKNQLIAA